MAIDFARLVKRIRKMKEEQQEDEERAQRGRLPEEIRVTGELKEEKDEEDEEREEHEKVGLEPPGFGTSEDHWWQDEEEQSESEKAEQDEEQKKDIDVRYPLIPNEPEQGERVFAWAHIFYDEINEELVYHLKEPDLDSSNQQVLNKVEDLLKERIDVDFAQLKREEARKYMQQKVREILKSHKFGLTEEDKRIIEYYAYRNFVGLDKVEPLMKDKNIEDLSCDGVGVPLYAYHRDPQIGSVKTNVVFNSDEKLDAFVRKLAQRCGRSISMAEPLLDGSLPDGSRVQATLGTDIARRGTNFTIRRFTEEPLTPVHLMEYGTINAKMLAYLWICVENGKSLLVSGATAAGKTTLLNALSLFIRPELKIVSIEDTPELRLPHPNWVPEVAREGFGFGEHATGQVTLDDLLKESLRQRPDYIIVGEVRGEEAYILFQQIATGHPGMSTIHANSLDKVMNRLTTKPIELPPSLIENLDLIVFAKRARRQDTYVRRVDKIYEFEGYDKVADRPITNMIFEWDAGPDEFDNPSDSWLLAEIAESRGVDVSEIQQELMNRKQVLEWMEEEGIKHYEDVGRILSTYYRHPHQILDKAEQEEV